MLNPSALLKLHARPGKTGWPKEAAAVEYVGDVALHCAFAINTAKEAMHPRAGLSRAHFAAAYMPPGPTDG